MAAVYSPDEGKLPSSKRPWATPRWQEDVVRAIALCPNEGPLIFTSDASKWPVRKRERKNEREGEKEREKEREKEKKEEEKGREPVKSPRGTRQRFPILDLSHFYSHPHQPEETMPFPSNSLASSRRSFLVRHTICSCEGKRSGEMGTSIPDTMPRM